MKILWMLILCFGSFKCAVSYIPEQCGRLESNETGFFHRFPWVAQIEFTKRGNEGNRRILCLGTLISPNYVLTSAVCARGTPRYVLFGVKLGGYSNDSESVNYKVARTLIHPEFLKSRNRVSKDIAIFELDEEVSLTSTIRPACLPPHNYTLKRTLKVVTWGNLLHEIYDTLHTIELPVVEQTDCASIYKTLNIEIGNSDICAGGEEGKDTCRGDQGGPLMDVEDDTVVGLTSFGVKDCGTAGWPGVYTKLTKHLSWINKTLETPQYINIMNLINYC